MDREPEEKVKQCRQCQATRHSPTQAPLHPREWPQRPMARVHVDYAGPFHGKMFLIMVDAYSKWIDVATVGSATSTASMEKLRTMFVTYGTLKTLVSDNRTHLQARSSKCS